MYLAYFNSEDNYYPKRVSKNNKRRYAQEFKQFIMQKSKTAR